MGKSVRRLYEQFKPSEYELNITIDKSAMKFRGSVIIKGKKTGRPSQRITLHQKGLKINHASISKLERSDKQPIAVSRINLHDKYDEVRLHADQIIYPGDYKISLDFEADITNAMHGIYPCFFEHNSEQKVLIATQFESHHAREVFPCIDEPEAKATFSLSLTAPSSETVLSNTPVVSQKKLDKKQTTTEFETTPIMSTYLLAFAAGDIHSVTGKTKDGIDVNTWATVAQPKNTLTYANREAIKILEFFTSYFETPFPLKKVDQIALPDFESGAMENWGLITYREIALLSDPDNRSQSSEQYVSMVVAHELSHQWFGNLVTMKWWDDLWLNESFASLMEHLALDVLHPDWFQWEQYTASDVLVSSARDMYKDVQSVSVEVKHPDEISTLFDPAIVYAKGGRLLKMMREFVGDDAFRKALKSYFAKYAYKNTAGDDLWNEMSHASGKNIKEFMDPWLKQSGMPLLTVDQNKEKITLTQERFILDKVDDQTLWPVPLLCDPMVDIALVDGKKAQISQSNLKPVIMNINGSGHYITRYLNTDIQSYIAESFQQKTLKPEARINILNDINLLSKKGIDRLTVGLEIAKKSSNEDRDAVWAIISRTISTAILLTEGNEKTKYQIYSFRQYICNELYTQLGWNDKDSDTPNEIGLRQTILSLMVASKHEDALSTALRIYKNAASCEKLPSEQRAMLISAAVRAGEADIGSLITEYKSSPNPDVQLSIASGLTNTEDPAVADYLLNEAMGENGIVRPQDIFRWYAYLMRNSYSRELTWQWLKDNWTRLEKLFGDSKSFEHFVSYSASPLNTPEWQNEFTSYFSPMTDIIALKRSILVALSEIDARVKWRQREEPVLIDYFADFTKSLPKK